MKKMKLTNIISFFLLLSLVVSMPTLAQKKDRTRVRAYYQKLPTNHKEIKVILTSGSGRSMKGIIGADILIENNAGEEPIALATIQTDTTGTGILQIEDGYTFELNEDGFVELMASFGGNDTLRASKRKIEFLDLDLSVEFKEVDSIKTVFVKAFKDSMGVKSPVEELEVKVGVKRMHSVLFLETIETDEDGVAEYEFPTDIPGDDIGNLKFVLQVFEDNDFGTVTINAEEKWGTIVDYSYNGEGRSLFGNEAPLWMIIGVVVVLVGAWFHFIWAIVKVWQIKKLGREA
jgi:hypothetical protein